MHNTQITENRPSLWMRSFFSLCVSFMAHEVKMKDWSAEFIHKVHLWPEGRVSKSSRRRWKELPVRLTLSGRSAGKREDWPVVILKLPELVSIVLSHWQPQTHSIWFYSVFGVFSIQNWVLRPFNVLTYTHRCCVDTGDDSLRIQPVISAFSVNNQLYQL